MGGCEKCGRLDSTLRASSFTYVISLILMTSRRGAGGVYCSSCRKKEGLKYTLVSAIFGWWGFPWGPIYTLQSIGRNSSGGYQDPELNAQLLQAVAAELIGQGDTSGAITALEESLRLNDDGDARQALWALKGEVASGVMPSHGGDSAPPIPSAAPSPSAFSPGALVRSRHSGTTLHAQPAESSELVGVLNSETAVVTRAQDGWLELRVPGASSGWVIESAIESA